MRIGKATEASYMSVREVYEKDGGRCQLCKKKIDWSIRWPDPMSMSVDHIIPISKGGTDDITNVQATHFHCNSKRQNKAGAQMRMF